MTGNQEQKNGVQITPVSKNEAPQAANILCRAFNLAVRSTKEDILNGLAADSRVTTLVASVDNEVVGVIRCAAAPREPRRSPAYSIFQLAVDEAFRQRGVGHALMQQAENQIAQELSPGQSAMVLLVDETKKKNPSSTFYEKMGYGPELITRRNSEGMPVLMKYVDNRQRRAASSPTN